MFVCLPVWDGPVVKTGPGNLKGSILTQAGLLWRVWVKTWPGRQTKPNSMCVIPRGLAHGRTALSKRIDSDVGGLALEGPELKTGPGFQKVTILTHADMFGRAPGSKQIPGS